MKPGARSSFPSSSTLSASRLFSFRRPDHERRRRHRSITSKLRFGSKNKSPTSDSISISSYSEHTDNSSRRPSEPPLPPPPPLESPTKHMQSSLLMCMADTSADGELSDEDDDALLYSNGAIQIGARNSKINVSDNAWQALVNIGEVRCPANTSSISGHNRIQKRAPEHNRQQNSAESQPDTEQQHSNFLEENRSNPRPPLHISYDAFLHQAEEEHDGHKEFPFQKIRVLAPPDSPTGRFSLHTISERLNESYDSSIASSSTNKAAGEFVPPTMDTRKRTDSDEGGRDSMRSLMPKALISTIDVGLDDSRHDPNEKKTCSDSVIISVIPDEIHVGEARDDLTVVQDDADDDVRSEQNGKRGSITEEFGIIRRTVSDDGSDIPLEVSFDCSQGGPRSIDTHIEPSIASFDNASFFSAREHYAHTEGYDNPRSHHERVQRSRKGGLESLFPDLEDDYGFSDVCVGPHNSMTEDLMSPSSALSEMARITALSAQVLTLTQQHQHAQQTSLDYKRQLEATNELVDKFRDELFTSQSRLRKVLTHNQQLQKMINDFHANGQAVEKRIEVDADRIFSRHDLQLLKGGLSVVVVFLLCGGRVELLALLALVWVGVDLAM